MQFPKEVIDLLRKHPHITAFQVEEALYTTDCEPDDLEEIVTYIFNSHPCLTGKMDHTELDIIQVLQEIEDALAAEKPSE